MAEMAMTIKEKILYLLSVGYSQIAISEKTNIPQSSISKILNEQQDDVLYSKGVLLDALVKSEQKQAA